MMNAPEDDDKRTIGNIVGIAITAVLICFSVLALLRLEHFIVRRDCYQQGTNACPSIGSGRSPHF